MKSLLSKEVNQARFWFLVLTVVAAIAVILYLIFSNGQSQSAIRVDSDHTSDISPLRESDDEDYDYSRDNSLRVAIAGVLSPSTTLESYQELLNYMARMLDKQVDLVLKPTYAEINDLVEGNRVDMAFVCTLAYVDGNDDFDMELLAAPQMHGRTEYYSYLIVPEGSNALSLDDLRNRSFAFTDPMSNSGHLAPTYQLWLMGETPASFFSRYTFTYSHDYSITAVADGLVNGAAVDSLVYDQTIAASPELGSRTTIISRWGPYGMPPVVIGPDINPRLRQQLRDFFLNLHHSEEGARILRNLSIDRFVTVPDDLYDSVREMKMALGW